MTTRAARRAVWIPPGVYRGRTGGVHCRPASCAPPSPGRTSPVSYP